MKTSLEINVLGELSVLRNGTQVALPQSMKTRALLAYLVVENRRQRRERLCEIFWTMPSDPRAALRWSLSKLRDVFGRDDCDLCLKADRTGVIVDTTQLTVDMHQVANLSARDIENLDTERLRDLARAFRGPFLEGLELPQCPVFGAWRTFYADALERTRRRILHEISQRPEDPSAPAAPYFADTGEDEEASDIPTGSMAQSRAVPGSPSGAVAPPPLSQEVHFCQSPDGTSIAFATSGAGPPLLRAAHWMSHLQYEWESPVWRHWLSALSRGNTLIRYDERGNGLSDWQVADFSLEAMVSDLESVVDANRLNRFPLMGVSQSCATAIAYAVRHPDRVSHLILYGGFSKGWRKRKSAHDRATHDAMTTLIREGWGCENPAFRQLFTEMFIPGASRAQMEWFNELQKETVSPENASRLHAAFGDIDVSDLLARVSVPTLVLHARHDSVVPFDEGKTMAAGITGARFVDLNSQNHLLLSDEPAFAKFVGELKGFIASDGSTSRTG